MSFSSHGAHVVSTDLPGGGIPRCADLASAVVVDAYDDMINPPGLTDRRLVVQADHDVLAIRSLSAPPIGSGELIIGQLILDGRLARSYGRPVETLWRPDRIERTSEIDGLRIATRTVCVPGRRTVLVDVHVTELAGTSREVALGVVPVSEATVTGAAWKTPVAPSAPNEIRIAGGRALAHDEGRTAYTVQGFATPAGQVGARIETVLSLAAGGSATTAFVVAVGQEEQATEQAFVDACADPAAGVRAAEEFWDETLASLFSAGGPFDGRLPVLHTASASLQALYLWGALGVAWFARDNPASVIGRTYDTVMPRYWQTTTFIWDYSLSSYVHAQVDPATMRRLIEHWVGLDIHSHFGTEWLTGGPAGYWYSVNDFAMTRLVSDYVRFTGDIAFLDHEVRVNGTPRAMIDLVDEWAHAWQGLRGSSPLADYGGIDNLMECVSTYVHEVAGLNAANVWCLTTVAGLRDLRGEHAEAARLRAEADDLLGHVMELYREGDGYFHTRMPDGRLVPTRHCYDFATVGCTIGERVAEKAAAEMAQFFVRELRTPAWMRALSPYDDDAGFSVRPDHQWNGAYPAWPADAGRALVRLGHADIALDWVDGLARSTRQGPPGQAHFTEEAAPTVDGGARKSPPQFPYLIDWACSSAGSWVQFVIEGLFGVDVALDGTVSATGHVAALDPTARLVGLRVAGRDHDIAADGTITIRD